MVEPNLASWRGVRDYIRRNSLDPQMFLNGMSLTQVDDQTVERPTKKNRFRTRTELSPDEQIAIVKSYKAGEKISKIARRYNILDQTVNKVLDGQVERTRKARRNQVDRNRVLELVELGVSDVKIAEIIECHKHTVRMIRMELREQGRL